MGISRKPRCRNRFAYRIRQSHGKYTLLIGFKGDLRFQPLSTTAWAKSLPIECEFSDERDAQRALKIAKEIIEGPSPYKNYRRQTE